MTPTLRGRIETRVVVLLTVGMLWTVVVSPLLPRPSWATLGMVYGITTRAVLIVIAAGIGWELIYHLLQQLRWDKDWPSIFALLTLVNEGTVAWIVLHWLAVIPGSSGADSPILPLFLIHFVTTWLVVWLFLQGPMRVIHLRWRFEGARFL